MKKILTLTFLVLSSVISFAQTYDFLGSDLKRLTTNRNIQLNPQTLEAYLTNGEKVNPAEVMNYIMKIEFQPVIYVDSNDNPKAIVFEEASEEAKAAKIAMFEKAPGSDFMINQTAPDFTLNSLENKPINLKDYKGQVVLLNFWFVGCKPCIMEMPELNEIVADYASRGITFLAIALDDPERINKFLETHDFDYTLLPNGRQVAMNYGVSSYPTHLLLDRNGKVVFSQKGYFPGLKYALRKRLDDALAKN